MSFTDDDLKRLKEDLIDPRYSAGSYCPNNGVLEALLARLEAAEAIVRHLDETPLGGYAQDGYESLLEAWRKASGNK